MTKSDNIEAVLALNPTASRTFLAQFSTEELAEYRRRLNERPRSCDAPHEADPGEGLCAAAAAEVLA